ncbi:flagellar hook length control protein FliK [Yokenella regensburgei]|uniref:flagellar hook length control protein FliK n=1 Tax=Yokenella regensburgei TaxID=158877 RepID=UPI003F145A71
MITLQTMLTTDGDATAGSLSGKAGGDAAQDFLALLAGALGGVNAAGEDAGATLSLTDLQNAGGKSAKNLRALVADNTGTPAQKLAALLARETSDAASLSADESVQMQHLLSGLSPTAKSDVLAALTKNSKSSDDTKTTLSDEEMSGLSALMAMLPHQQTAQLTPKVQTTDASVSATVAASGTPNASSLTGKNSDLSGLATQSKAEGAQTQQTFSSLDDAFQSAAALAVKKEADSASQTVNTTTSLAPVISQASSAQASAPVSAAVLSAPLGSNEWQQTLSQHVTLFTRQGQQNAELHLHPEELGKIQISLKIDDNNMAQLQMVSQHSHVRQALEAALPTLRTSLAESGIQLGQSNISSESFAGQQHAFSDQQQSSRSGRSTPFATEDDEPLITPASLQSAARGNSAVDIFA